MFVKMIIYIVYMTDLLPLSKFLNFIWERESILSIFVTPQTSRVVH